MRGAWLVAARELRADARHPDGFATAVTFVAALVLIESIVVGPQVARETTVAPALYWIALLFAAIVVTTRSFDRELADDAIDAVLALPGGRDALYAGKLIALAATIAAVGLVGGVLQIALLDLTLALPGHALVAVALGVIALPAVVIIDVALTLRLRGRAALVPVLAVPALLPQLVAATNALGLALSGDATGSLAWSGLLLAIALVYAVLGLTIAGTAIE
ncbi:MAG: heme exporter protein CcmB [Chloroflexi bacterium]|nr:heme exporter protein CcmB [Chloroflexota bacterium]MBI2982738.1 heme exporter protein CcmB [Chloroflexota bacterium]